MKASRLSPDFTEDLKKLDVPNGMLMFGRMSVGVVAIRSGSRL